MHRQEAKVESQKAETKSLQRNLHSTQDSLNSWDAVKLSSIQDVCVDDSIGTYVSSVSRVAEPSISHLPQAGCARAVPTKRAFNAESITKIGCSSEYATTEQLESSIGSTQFIFSYGFFAD